MSRPPRGVRIEPAWPTTLRFQKAKRRLLIAFDNGFEGEIPYARLRLESPSAETRGHGGAQNDKRPPPHKGTDTVGVEGADPVGRYAVRIRFTDGHDTGLYTWAYLRELAERA